MSNDKYIAREGEGYDLRKGKRRPSQTGARAASDADRLPPHSIDAEQFVLGCLMLAAEGEHRTAAEEAMSHCEERHVNQGWFYDLKHQVVWLAIESLYDAGRMMEVSAVVQWLKDRNELEACGGLPFLANLPNLVASPLSLPAFLETVREKWMRRRILQIAAGMSAGAVDEASDLTEGIAATEKAVLALSEETTGRAEKPVRELVLECLDRFEKNYVRGHAQITGLTTGLSYFDKVTGGLGGENGHYICVAARPGEGKTSIALEFLVHAALRYEWYSALKPEAFKVQGSTFNLEPGEALPENFLWAKDHSVIFQKHTGIPCAFFSLEMTDQRLVERVLFQHSGADLQRFRTGFANAGDFALLGKSAAAIGQAPIWIDDTARLNMDMLKARARRMVRQYGIKLFVVDYIQLLKSVRARHQRPDRVSELEEISAEFQALGKELQVDFVILGQLNRDVAKSDRWRRPQASDIKNCGAIEQDADQIILLYRPRWTAIETSEEYEEWTAQVRAVQAQELMRENPQWTREELTTALSKGDWSKRMRRVNALVEKNRYGMTGDSQLVLDGACTHFMDYGDWQKKHGLKAIAAGEARSKGPDDGDLPSNEEMGL